MKITVMLCLAAAGCAKTDSSDLLSTGIYASIAAVARGDGTTDVRATLYVGNPLNLNFVDLTGDDRLVASYGNQEKVMSETIILNIVTHHAEFPNDNAGDQFQVAFERTVDDGAPNSIAVLPDKFTLTPPVSTTVSRAAQLDVTWSPIETGSKMRWEARGDCIDLVSETLAADTGSFSIEADRIKKRQGETITDECPLTVTVTRARDGQLDPGYGKGGTVEGQQVRTLMLTSTP